MKRKILTVHGPQITRQIRKQHVIDQNQIQYRRVVGLSIVILHTIFKNSGDFEHIFLVGPSLYLIVRMMNLLRVLDKRTKETSI